MVGRLSGPAAGRQRCGCGQGAWEDVHQRPERGAEMRWRRPPAIAPSGVTLACSSLRDCSCALGWSVRSSPAGFFVGSALRGFSRTARARAHAARVDHSPCASTPAGRAAAPTIASQPGLLFPRSETPLPARPWLRPLVEVLPSVVAVLRSHPLGATDSSFAYHGFSTAASTGSRDLF